MSAVTPLNTAPALALLAPADTERALARHHGRVVAAGEYAADLAALGARASARRQQINLCEDRYHFLVAFGAALSRGQTTLLPAARAPAKIDELRATFPDSENCDDADVAAVISQLHRPHAPLPAAIPAALAAVVSFTSGSTGQPRPHLKRWDGFVASTACNQALIAQHLERRGLAGTPWIVATVPPQHMFGLEFSVLMPLLGGMAVHAGRPLFPADVAQALAEVPAPRILVSTPIHLGKLVDSGVAFPEVALVLSATAPLAPQLAQRVEQCFATELLELFGSTETCAIASRRTARELAWTPHAGVALEPGANGSRVTAPWLASDTELQDLIELTPERRFVLRGRHADMVEIAGKRASLAELTARLLAIPGVLDAVVCQPEADGAVRRVAALVVAPGISEAEIVRQLLLGIDPAFLPRPLLRLDALPRNEVGKLTREQLLKALATSSLSPMGRGSG